MITTLWGGCVIGLVPLGSHGTGAEAGAGTGASPFRTGLILLPSSRGRKRRLTRGHVIVNSLICHISPLLESHGRARKVSCGESLRVPHKYGLHRAVPTIFIILRTNQRILLVQLRARLPGSSLVKDRLEVNVGLQINWIRRMKVKEKQSTKNKTLP